MGTNRRRTQKLSALPQILALESIGHRQVLCKGKFSAVFPLSMLFLSYSPRQQEAA